MVSGQLTLYTFQVFAFENVRAQDWFVPFDSDNPSYSNTSAEGLYNQTTIADSEVACWENYAIFTVSSFQGGNSKRKKMLA